MINVNELALNKKFSRRLAMPDTWIINCYSESLENPNPHVLIGEEYALVIDTTNTKLPLREYIETYITDKPLMVASTHSHFDHTLANSQFNDCPIYMSEIAWQEIQESRIKGYGRMGEGHVLGDYTPIIIKEGDVIDLGGRQVEVISFGGCHSPGSIGYIDKKYGIFFPGDELECGQVLIQGEGRGGKNSVELYRENLLHIKEKQDEINIICPPHNGTPVHAQIIDHFIENCDRILSGIEGESDIGSMSYLLSPHEPRPPEKVKALRSDPNTRRSEWMGTSLVYSIDRVFKR